MIATLIACSELRYWGKDQDTLIKRSDNINYSNNDSHFDALETPF